MYTCVGGVVLAILTKARIAQAFAEQEALCSITPLRDTAGCSNAQRQQIIPAPHLHKAYPGTGCKQCFVRDMHVLSALLEAQANSADSQCMSLTQDYPQEAPDPIMTSVGTLPFLLGAIAKEFCCTVSV